MFMKVGKGLLSVGAAYLAQQVARYNTLKADIEPMSLEEPKVIGPVVEAEKKEWLIFGRQSPGYVRDPEKNPKTHLHEKIESNPLWVKGLGTNIDNEKHYDLFQGSDFVVEQFTSQKEITPVKVKPECMLSTDLQDIDDKQHFQVGFARKQGFADITQKSPFYHSSIALRVVGEDSPPDPESVVMTGFEIKQVFAKTNEDICHAQHCDLYQSNCYTASTYAVTQIVETISKREESETKQKQMQAVSDAIPRIVDDNFGRGISNNEKIRTQLNTVLPSILEQHHLWREIPKESTYEPPDIYS